MTPAENLARLLPEGATLDDVSTAFSWTHPKEPRYAWTAKAKSNSSGEIIKISGTIFHDMDKIGEFERRLYYEKGFRCAKHIQIEIFDKAHRKNDIATHHYRRAIALYQRLHYRYVYLDADVDGPAVWPQFGFDLAKRNDKELLLSIMKQFGVLVEPKDLFAPLIASLDLSNPDQELLGLKILKELRNRSGGPLAMVLDLESKRQLEMLP